MNTIQIIKETFLKANDRELIDLDKIAVIKGYENIKTPEKYLEKYLDNQKPINEATYFKDGYQQCDGGRNRSFVDLYAILRAKFPRLKIDRFAYILCMYQLNNRKSFYTSYCFGVHKIVMRCHKSYGDRINSRWVLGDKFQEVKNTEFTKDVDALRDNDYNKSQGDGVTIKKITELANYYLTQLKNK